MTTMTDPTLDLLEASERLERAEADRRVAELRYTTLVADAPLRFKVEAIERLRRADAELDAARAAYEAAQDVDCPEAWVMTTTKRAAEMTQPQRSVGTSADAAFDRLLAEATAIATRIAHELADGQFPEGSRLGPCRGHGRDGPGPSSGVGPDVRRG